MPRHGSFTHISIAMWRYNKRMKKCIPTESNIERGLRCLSTTICSRAMTSSNMGGNLMKRFLLREERGGTGFLFDRKTGKAEAVLPQGLAAYRASADVDSLPLLELTPSHARIAPFCVWVELTRACNLKCPYCGASNQGASSSLPAAQIAEMFQQFAQCGVFEVRLTGGEPTLHPEFSKIVDAAARIGLFVSVNSNGVLPD